MRFETFSKSQLTALTWWSDASPYRDRDAIICDGAVRSGKTLCTSLSFVCWAMRRFDGARFGLCGKTILSLRRNVVSVLLPLLTELGFDWTDGGGKNRIDVRFNGHANSFYLFGGRDEAAAAHIQGVTFAGVLLDEAALMPRSFVEQAVARCSVEGAKLWFSCNPEGPYHWFYTDWIQKAEEKNALYVRFRLEDNPSLSRAVIARYLRMYSGAFYRRFVLGEWAVTEGLVYDFFSEELVADVPEGPWEECAVSCDYGTANPTSMGLWARRGQVWYRVREYYWDSRREKRQKTDADYVSDLAILLGGARPSFVVADPSAASFITALRREGYRVIRADNDVLTGIRVTADMLRSGTLVVCRPCADAIREFSLYRWQEGGARDAPVKLSDHAMDDIRYFAMAVKSRDSPFAAVSVARS